MAAASEEASLSKFLNVCKQIETQFTRRSFHQFPIVQIPRSPNNDVLQQFQSSG